MPICKILKRAIEVYGIKRQTMKCIEEVGELLQAVSKYEFATDLEEKRKALDHLQEEIADCCIMLEQMKMMYGEREVTKKIMEKIERLDKRLDSM